MKFNKINLIAPALAAMMLSACNGGSAGSAPEGAANDNTNAMTRVAQNNGGNSNLVGESCVSNDPDKLCLAVRFITYKNSDGNATASQEQAAQITSTMNKLFAQCNIGFQVETYEAVDPAQEGLTFGAGSQSETDQIRGTYQSNNELLSVTTGPWGTSVNAWTAMPGDGGNHGAIMESSIVGYGGGIIYAHEFGHYLGLDHESDTSNLMNPVIHTSSEALSDSQCQMARKVSTTDWASMLRK